jgi:hypothetical protein
MALTGLVSAAEADQPVVVELFTSQGCSSCPPADALLAEMADRDDVIPLALHVDYWDYIGWKDRFAMPEFTARQKGYARAGDWRMIYTPQMVINGVDDVVGSKPMKVADLIRKHADKPSHVDLEIRREGDRLLIRAEANGAMRPCDIHIVRYAPMREIAIGTGENAGRKLSYSHVANSWKVAARWDGEGVYMAELALDGDEPVVVLVQEPDHGAIVAAARLR